MAVPNVALLVGSVLVGISIKYDDLQFLRFISVSGRSNIELSTHIQSAIFMVATCIFFNFLASEPGIIDTIFQFIRQKKCRFFRLIF